MGGFAEAFLLSCASAGNCAADGDYADGSGSQQAFLASKVSGHWRNAFEVSGSGALNAGGAGQVSAVSCASAGNCAAGGYYTEGAGHRKRLWSANPNDDRSVNAASNMLSASRGHHDRSA